jgi:hypothetical protein
MGWSDLMQKIYNFNNCFDTIQGRLYKKNSALGIEVTASTDTRLAPESITGTNSSVFVTFSNQNSIPFPIGATISLSGVLGNVAYNGTFSVTTASITSGLATVGWSSSASGPALISASEIKFAPENKIVLSSVAGLTAGMSVVGTGISASATISSISSSANFIVLSKENTDLISSGQFLYIGRNLLIDTKTPLECLNVYKRKVISSGLTGDPTKDTILQMQKAFEEALAQSPSSEEVVIVEDPTGQHRLSLITQSKEPKWDQDTKNIAIPFSEQIDIGKTIDWIRTGYKYLVLTQNLTQKAYFSGQIQQCNFLLNWKDNSGNTYSQYVVVDGPKEKEDDFKKFFGLSIDEGSGVLLVLIGKTDGSKVLKRYDRIILNEKAWEIILINDMENDNIIRFALKENFVNKDIDDTTNSIANNTEPAVGELRSLILGDL